MHTQPFGEEGSLSNTWAYIIQVFGCKSQALQGPCCSASDILTRPLRHPYSIVPLCLCNVRRIPRSASGYESPCKCRRLGH